MLTRLHLLKLDLLKVKPIKVRQPPVTLLSTQIEFWVKHFLKVTYGK